MKCIVYTYSRSSSAWYLVSGAQKWAIFILNSSWALVLTLLFLSPGNILGTRASRYMNFQYILHTGTGTCTSTTFRWDVVFTFDVGIITFNWHSTSHIRQGSIFLFSLYFFVALICDSQFPLVLPYICQMLCSFLRYFVG